MKELSWIVIALLLAAPAVAQDSGFYIGAAAGKATVKNYCESHGFFLSCSDSANAWKIFGGYQFSRHFSLEAAYTDMGEARATVSELNSFRRAMGIFQRESTHTTEAREIVAIGWLPVANRLSLYGKFGMYRGEVVEYDRICCNQVTSEGRRDLTYGIGARLNVTRNFGLRTEWQNYQELGPTVGHGWSDVEVFNVGLFARF